MSNISYAIVVHQPSERIVYKTRTKRGGPVEPTILHDPQPPFGDICWVGDTLQTGYVIRKVTLDRQERIDAATQRFDLPEGALRASTPDEETEYRKVLSTAKARLIVDCDEKLHAVVAVITWVCAKTSTTVADAESEITAAFNGFHLSRFEETGPAKIAELFEKYHAGDD